MSEASWKSRFLLWACGVLAVAAACSWYFRKHVPVTSESLEIPSVSSSRFLNTSSEAAYVGSEACAECHSDEYDSYLQTRHSQSLSDINLSSEPPDGEFTHAPSGRSYRVYRKGDELRHREFVRTNGSEELVLSDFAMRDAIGSGRFSRSYLVEIDGFLVESPVTWYAAKRDWGMSPGFDKYNLGFERPAEIRCINCHAGRIESVDDSFHRMIIHEQAVSCERCHGPGSLHVERWDSDAELTSETDLTIVHPEHLSRELKESICAQCHLHSAATVHVRGRETSDFRPGLPLKDFRIHYALQSHDKSMKVVGHMEQMRLSRCYQASETLTCTTCHSLHAKPTAEEQLTFYRKKCLTCHTDQECNLTRAERIQKNPQDNCVACHMPRVPTEIPHFAFTHHRIGKHTSEPTVADIARQAGTLVPLDDVSHLRKIDRDRCLGLAYMQLLDGASHAEHAATYDSRARELLEDVRRRGLRDPEVDAALARLFWSRDSQRTIEMAESVLKHKSPSPDARATALFTLGSTYFQRNNFEQAIPILERLVRIRRFSQTWFMLSVCRERTSDMEGAIEAARKGADISPHRPDFQFRLAELYRQVGNNQLAEKHLNRAQQLDKYIPQPSK